MPFYIFTETKDPGFAAMSNWHLSGVCCKVQEIEIFVSTADNRMMISVYLVRYLFSIVQIVTGNMDHAIGPRPVAFEVYRKGVDRPVRIFAHKSTQDARIETSA